MEYNDIYDENRQLTGRIHRRGSSWKRGEYGLVVCVWIYDGRGNLLLTRRAPGKSFAGTWENSGGAAKAGETSRQAIARELFEETGLIADEMTLFMINSGPEVHYVYPTGDEVSNVEIIYLCKKYHGTLKRQEEEIEELRFFAPEDVPDAISPPIRPVVEKYLRMRQKEKMSD